MGHHGNSDEDDRPYCGKCSSHRSEIAGLKRKLKKMGADHTAQMESVLPGEEEKLQELFAKYQKDKGEIKGVDKMLFLVGFYHWLKQEIESKLK